MGKRFQRPGDNGRRAHLCLKLNVVWYWSPKRFIQKLKQFVLSSDSWMESIEVRIPVYAMKTNPYASSSVL